jgi:hypothetical protein
MRERSFNVGDQVLRRIQYTKGMHKLSAPWEGPGRLSSDLPPSVVLTVLTTKIQLSKPQVREAYTTYFMCIFGTNKVPRVVL